MPKIIKYSWGIVNVEGYEQPFKDVKLNADKAEAWDWRKTGTKHSPGIQISDIEELVQNNCKVVILSTGIEEQLNVCNETIDYLNDNNVKYHILQTDKAIFLYNELHNNERIGAVIHSTC